MQQTLENILVKHHKGILNIECNERMSNLISSFLQSNTSSISILFKDDSLYECMMVKNYLSFFAQLTNHNSLLEESILAMHLQDVVTMKIKELSFSLKRRVAIARGIITDCDCFLLQEPLLNLNNESISCVLEWIEKLLDSNKKIITTSVSLKHVCLLPGTSYYANEKEVKLIDNLQESDDITPLVVVEKISAKLDDKILLFNPNEIDYIESIEGKSFLNVRDDSFACSLTLDELETKLKRFGFYRCHRSYLVNMQKVTKIVKWTRNSYSLNVNSHQDLNIPLSKGRIDEMKTLYHV